MTDIYFKKTRSESERNLVAYSWFSIGWIWFLASQLYWICDITIGPVLFLRCSFQSIRSAVGDSAPNDLISSFQELSSWWGMVRRQWTTTKHSPDGLIPICPTSEKERSAYLCIYIDFTTTISVALRYVACFLRSAVKQSQQWQCNY